MYVPTDNIIEGGIIAKVIPGMQGYSSDCFTFEVKCNTQTGLVKYKLLPQCTRYNNIRLPLFTMLICPSLYGNNHGMDTLCPLIMIVELLMYFFFFKVNIVKIVSLLLTFLDAGVGSLP